MPNTNCLEGMRCPVCGSEEAFFITVTKQVRMTDDGSEEVDSDEEWDDNSPCSCAMCDSMGGTVAVFKVET